MRILQVVTLLSPDGAFGGPARVALNQSAELISRGHDVTVAAATRGYPDPPHELQGVPLKLFTARKLFPRKGFAGLGAPGLSRWFGRNATEFDVVHIHFGRDLVVLPVAAATRRHKIPYVLQTHGMVAPSSRAVAPVLDAVLTRRLLREAGTVFYLTEGERQQLMTVANGQLRLAQLGNGVPSYSGTPNRADIREVLFAARMHARKRPAAFVDMAKALLDAGVDARFTLIGPDEGEGDALRAAIADEPRIRWEGTLEPDAVPRRMAAANVFVLPAVREPYPMAVLEAMSVGLPVVICGDCGLAPLVDETHCGIVAEPNVPALAAAVRSILDDPSRARAMGERGREAAHSRLSMRTIGDRLMETYAGLVDGRR